MITRRAALASAAGMIGAAAAPALAQTAYDPAIETATTIGDGFTLAAVGDIIYPLPLAGSPDPRFQAAIRPIRDADLGYGNLEMSIIDAPRFQGVPSYLFMGSPDVAEDLRAMGFDALGRANNHLYDYGPEGMIETNAHLDRAGIVHSGSGPNYGAARAPRYLMTRKGRVAFVTAATTHSPTFTPLFQIVRALPASSEMPGRPGMSVLGTTQIFNVPPSLAESVRAVKRAFPTGGALYAPTADTPTRFSAMGQEFQVADVDRPQFTYEVDQNDVNAILRSVREGKAKSDFLVFGLHTHETRYAAKPDTDPEPGDFLQGFARQVIDAGADSFVGAGVHVLRGIEIYRGRPIYYGLGEFFRQMDINRPSGQAPQRGDVNSDPAKYESVVAVNRFDGGALAEVRLHPVTLGASLRMAHRGVPRAASPAEGRRILERLQALSAPYGTRIAIEGDVGVIRLGAAGRRTGRSS
ncbi:CapA family protein [Phenylobacterium sp.]|uniref:CapA family protein n=1 Tax=Phenylobacterium sp. TaxID=1871053 RepID=UPI002FDF5967